MKIKNANTLRRVYGFYVCKGNLDWDQCS